MNGRLSVRMSLVRGQSSKLLEASLVRELNIHLCALIVSFLVVVFSRSHAPNGTSCTVVTMTRSRHNEKNVARGSLGAFENGPVVPRTSS